METRRNFIKTALTSATGFSILPNWVIGASKPPSEKLNVAFVGIGGRGAAACNDLCHYDRVNPVCFVDVDEVRAANIRKEFPNVPFLRDYRKLFDKFGKDIDAVVISTPDHTHYPIAAWTMAHGKHVYIEKPMSRTIWEGREIKRIAQKTGVITQLGNQGHTVGPWRNVKAWFDAGILGDVSEVYIWTDRPVWKQGTTMPKPNGKEKIPSTLDFNLWLNVAPDAQYSSDFVPFNWRGLQAYGTGAMGDHACHIFDWAYSSLGLGFPTEIVGRSDSFDDYTWPRHTTTTFNFPANDKRGAVKLHWYDTYLRPKEIKGVPTEVIRKTANGAAIVGSKETAMCFDQFGKGTIISPRERMKDLMKAGALPKVPKPESSHHRNWVNACMAGHKANSDIVDYAADINELVLMGCIPIFFPNEPLHFDAKKREFDNPAANAHFFSKYMYKKEFLPYNS